jgi:hypothetical protein
MVGRRLAAAERQHQQHRQAPDAPSEHRHHVERRIVRPVDVLEDHHRRHAQLGDQQRLHLGRRRAAGERPPELG